MKKIVIGFVLMLLAGCAEKQQYEAAVLEQMKQDKDIKDYKLEVDTMTECVVTESSKKMPGLFAFDPEKLTAYKNYTKMLEMNKSQDIKKALEELREQFGSAKNLAEAHASYTESVMYCIAGLLTSTEPQVEEKK